MRRTAFAIAAAFTLPLAAQQLTADEAVRIALRNNIGVRISRISADQAALANNPGTAGMLPGLDANGGYSVNNSATKQKFFSGEERNADNANTKALSGDIELSWTLFDGLSMFATKDRLEALERIGKVQLRQEMESTTYDVLTTYYQLVQLEKAEEVQREGMKVSRERLKIAETGERVGSSSGLELVQARLDLSTDSAEMLALSQQVATARTALNILLSRDPATAFEVDTVIPPTPSLDLDTLRRSALSANTTLQQAREERIVADKTVKELRGILLPRLDGFANYGYARTTSDVGVLESNRNIGPQYGLTLSVPLFHGGVNKAVAQAKLAGQQADLTLEQAQLQLERNLLDSWNNFSNANQRVDLEKGNLIGARTQMDVALESYRVGVTTAVELRDVQRSLIAAENRLLMARFEAKTAELQMRWLAGTLL
jgi:outer membrane protein TolC